MRNDALLHELAGEVVVHAHHGSVAPEQRLIIEERLKAGHLPAIVATSSLELGIDMGAIDLVIHVEAPPGVASALQRNANETMSAQTPNVPMRLSRMISSLRSRDAPPPKPSAVSARPSSCRQPVRSIVAASEIAAAGNGGTPSRNAIQ